MRSIQELNDVSIIDIGIKSILDFGKEELVPHFFYCGEHYLFTRERTRRLEKIFLAKMKHYGVQFSILTQLSMWRWKLVTTETVKKAYQGKLKNDEYWKDYEGSIHDDVETFFNDLQDRKNIKNENVRTFFTPKLTEEELKLVEQRNEQHLSTYAHPYPDVDAKEMKKSDSSSKFVHGRCGRRTIPLKLEANRKLATDKNTRKTKKKCIIL